MKNKRRIEDLRKEILSKEGTLNWRIDSGVGDYQKLDKDVMELKTKLSENILAHNNCLDDFSEKVKDRLVNEDDEMTYILHEIIDKIKNEMKLK